MRLPLFVVVALAAGCSRTAAPLEDRSPVRGSVTIAGKPAPGLMVRFHLAPGSGDQRAAPLVEVLTDADGTFRVSQNAADDGLAPGKYTVTFVWPPGGDPDAPPSADQLRGRYSNPERSKFQIEVPAPALPLPPFQLN